MIDAAAFAWLLIVTVLAVSAWIAWGEGA